MNYSICASITPKAAARLLLAGEIDLTDMWQTKAAKEVLEELLSIQIEEVLQIVDCNTYGAVADVKYIPQFGKIDSLIAVPNYFVENGQSIVDYAQLGFFLKKDVDAKLDANIKFGENHGKGAAILGIVNCIDKRIVPSALSNAFCELLYDQKVAIIKRLLFRVPVVQIILKEARAARVNGYDPMIQLKESTRRRRSQCLRAIFKLMEDYHSTPLETRLNNIFWEDSEVQTDA